MLRGLQRRSILRCMFRNDVTQKYKASRLCSTSTSMNFQLCLASSEADFGARCYSACRLLLWLLLLPPAFVCQLLHLPHVEPHQLRRLAEGKDALEALLCQEQGVPVDVVRPCSRARDKYLLLHLGYTSFCPEALGRNPCHIERP